MEKQQSDLTIRIRLGATGEPVDLLLLEQLGEYLRGAFRELLKETAGSEKINVSFKIRDAAKGSIALVLEPAATAPGSVDLARISSTLISDINNLAAGEPRATIGTDLLGQYKALVGVGNRAGGLEMSYGERNVRITEETRISFQAAMSEHPVPEVAVVGLIETVNIHRRPWTFGLYTKLDRQRVECRFADEMLDAVLNHLESKSFAQVRGEGRFGQAGITPSRIDLSEPPDALPGGPVDILAFAGTTELVKETETAAQALARLRESLA